MRRTSPAEQIARVLGGEATRRINFAVTVQTDTALTANLPAVNQVIPIGPRGVFRPQLFAARTISGPPLTTTVTINRQGFSALADALRAGSISVSVWNASTGQYDVASNDFKVPASPARSDRNATVDYQALVIHEATHALCDMANLARTGKVRAPTSEAIAYLAQAIALKTAVGSSDFTVSEPILREALKMVDFFGLYRGARSATPPLLHENQLFSLKQVISADAVYSRSANSWIRFDGIPSPNRS